VRVRTLGRRGVDQRKWTSVIDLFLGSAQLHRRKNGVRANGGKREEDNHGACELWQRKVSITLRGRFKVSSARAH